MAFLGEAKKDQGSPWKIYVCLNEQECELLMKSVGTLLGRCLRTLEYYKDIHEGGEATEKQVDKLVQAQEAFENVISIRDSMQEMIKFKGK